ncbi:MAG: LCP family protein [Clostridia bacterium]|nr:LCP family protein [Clostridia bacterium]
MKNTNRKANSFLRVFTNIFIVFFVVVYIMFLLPAVKFMNNGLSKHPEPSEKVDVTVNRDDNLIDMSALLEEEETGTPEDPEETPPDTEHTSPVPEDSTAKPTEPPTATPDPSDVNVDNPGGSSKAPYSDPIVDGVLRTVGGNVKLEPDAKNLLVLGHDVRSNLTDTIIVYSICERLHSITVLSLSRDAYVPYRGAVQSYLVSSGLSKSPGMYKLNACYAIGSFIKYNGGKFGNSGIDFLCHIITEMMPQANMHIDDYIFINPDGLEGFVDYFGGVDVYFSEDRWIPSNGTTTVLKYTQGWHHLNGAEAVNYVRTRARYDETGRIPSEGDPYRKSNQLRFVKDFLTQIITIENLGRISEIFDEASKFMYHSIRSASQLATYTRMARDFAHDKYSVESYVVSGKSINPLGDGASYVSLMY